MSDPSETPSWAAAEPPIGEEKPKKCSLPGFLDGGAEKDEAKLGENELAAKHLCKFVGVVWSTKHTKWKAGWKCLNIIICLSRSRKCKNAWAIAMVNF